MVQYRNSQQKLPGLYDKSGKEGVTAVEMIALSLSVLWFFGVAVFFLVIDPEGIQDGTNGSLHFIMLLFTVFMPVAMIWIAATLARSSRVMREESRRLQSAIDAMRHTYVTQNHGANPLQEPTVTRKLDEIAAAQRKTETAIATFSSSRPPTMVRPTPIVDAVEDTAGDQVALPLGTSAEDIQAPLEQADFIRALNFPETAEDKPETAEDKEGFTALRRALKDRSTAQLIQASQDLLTLMSQDGIYMDDLRPDMARPEIWRRFAAGERGRPVAALGRVRDRSSLALTAARMKNDPIFRDAAHHFLRLFDRMFTQFAETASDMNISDLSNTRTARAFMLVGRVAGTFD